MANLFFSLKKKKKPKNRLYETHKNQIPDNKVQRNSFNEGNKLYKLGVVLSTSLQNKGIKANKEKKKETIVKCDVTKVEQQKCEIISLISQQQITHHQQLDNLH